MGVDTSALCVCVRACVRVCVCVRVYVSVCVGMCVVSCVCVHVQVTFISLASWLFVYLVIIIVHCKLPL